jgi:hypothetical protein
MSDEPILFCPKRMFTGLFFPDWLCALEITWTAKAVYSAAAGEADGEWVEFTHHEMSGRLGMDPSTVKRATNALVEAGLIIRERTGHARIQGGSNRYAFVWREEFGGSLRRGQIAPPVGAATGRAERPARGGQQTPPVGGGSPPPLIEEEGKDLREEQQATEGRLHAERLCGLLADHVERQSDERPRITDAWLRAARLMVDRDGRTPEQIERAIAWVAASEFWAPNILAMPKLRAKWPTLVAQAKRDARRNGNALDREVRRSGLREWAESEERVA